MTSRVEGYVDRAAAATTSSGDLRAPVKTMSLPFGKVLVALIEGSSRCQRSQLLHRTASACFCGT